MHDPCTVNCLHHHLEQQTSVVVTFSTDSSFWTSVTGLRGGSQEATVRVRRSGSRSTLAIMEMIKFSSFFLVVMTVDVSMTVATASGCSPIKVCAKTIFTLGKFRVNPETAGPVHILAKNGADQWPFLFHFYSSIGFPRGQMVCTGTVNCLSAVDAVIVQVGNDNWWPDYIRFCPNKNGFYHCQWQTRCGAKFSTCLIQNRNQTIPCSWMSGNGCP